MTATSEARLDAPTLDALPPPDEVTARRLLALLGPTPDGGAADDALSA